MKKFLIFIFLFFNFNSTFLILNCICQWVQQNLPLTTGYFNDMKFVNANTGFITNSTPLLIKTTNSGFNWQVMNNFTLGTISIIDSTCMYITGYNNLYSKLYKSSNCGLSWDSLLPAYSVGYSSIYFFNKDTGLISGADGYNNYIWRTTNGGISKELLFTISGSFYGKFFFLKEKENGEYYGLIYNGPFWYKTTNSGLNWQSMPNIPTSYQTKCIFFINKDTGWATIANMVNYIYYTTNGGNNWGTQILPNLIDVSDIYFANSRKGWIGCYTQKILATSDGGLNWGSQDITNGTTSKLFFFDSLIGWAGNGNLLSYTTNGGGVINSIFSNVNTVKYSLDQNYPNPFNSITNIKYEIASKKFVKLKIFDIVGKEVAILVNKQQTQGKYEVMFEGTNFSSGVYFYSLFLDGVRVDTKKLILLK